MTTPTASRGTPTRATTTKAQVQAYRFGMRRLENAVATAQPYQRTLGGPRPNLAMIIGVVLAALGLAGFAVYAFISPEPSIGDAKVVVDSDHGGAYVVRNHTLYPALNLSSALLAAGASGTSGGAGKPAVKVVDASTLSGMAKGQTLGIIGAPNLVPSEGSLVSGSWTVCDSSTVNPAAPPTSPPVVTTTAVLGGAPGVPANLPANGAALVTPVGGTGTYLLTGNRVSRVDTTDRAVRLVLDIDRTTPRPISPGLLAAVPAGQDITAPTIPGTVGAPVGWDPDLAVGTVFQVQFADETRSYVALGNGYQRVTPLVADLVRAEEQSTATIPRVPPSTLKRTTEVSPIPVDDYPDQRPSYYPVSASSSTLCLSWNGQQGTGARYLVYPSSGVPLPGGSAAVPAPPRADPGTVNFTYVGAGHGAVYGQVVGNQAPTDGALFLVTDQGIKYPVVSTTALAYLGLDSSKGIRAAPPTLLNLLPTGPTLDPAQATGYFDERTSR